MASTIVEFRAPTGMTLDLDLYPYGSDTIANGASGDAATEQTNRKGVYQATVTEALTGWHTAHIMSGATVIAVYDVDLLDDTSTYRCHDRDQVQTGDSFARLGAPAGASIAADVAAVQADLPVRVTKNVALANFPFMMLDTDGNPATGLTVSATRRIDSGSFAACANSPSEIANGWYTIDFDASDLNGDTIAILFTATGAKDLGITFVTQP